MGNRLEEGVCLGCGGILIAVNEYHCCSACTEKVKKKLYQLNQANNVDPKLRKYITLGPGTKQMLAARDK